LLTQLNSLQDKSQELELKLKLQETEADTAQKELYNKIEDLEQQKASLSNRIKEFDTSRSMTIEQLEKKYKEDIEKLEQEIEEKQASGENDIK
jgi:hypothetical protein